MKKLFVLLALLVGCATTSTGRETPLRFTPPVAPTTQTVRGEDWLITLPLGYESKRMPILLPAGVSVKAFGNMMLTRLVVITREEDAYSKRTEKEYVERFTQQMISGGFAVVGAVDQTMINGKTFSKVEINKDGTKMYVFAHVQSGIAHVVMCGGILSDTQLESVCTDIAHTFQMD